jgi:hypothetical protein
MEHFMTMEPAIPNPLPVWMRQVRHASRIAVATDSKVLWRLMGKEALEKAGYGEPDLGKKTIVLLRESLVAIQQKDTAEAFLESLAESSPTFQDDEVKKQLQALSTILLSTRCLDPKDLESALLVFNDPSSLPHALIRIVRDSSGSLGTWPGGGNEKMGSLRT